MRGAVKRWCTPRCKSSAREAEGQIESGMFGELIRVDPASRRKEKYTNSRCRGKYARKS